jgi:putative nucleotidyltransferase with HDIG domain
MAVRDFAGGLPGQFVKTVPNRTFQLGDVLTEPIYGPAPGSGGRDVLLLAAGARIDSAMKLRRLQEAGFAVILPAFMEPARGVETTPARIPPKVIAPRPVLEVPVVRKIESIPFPERLQEAEKIRTTIGRVAGDLQKRIMAGSDADPDLLRESSAWLANYVATDPQAIATLAFLSRVDDYLVEHSTDVSILMVGMAGILGYTQPELQQIALAGLMHDAGKQRIPRSLLEKAAPLTPEEEWVLRSHPQEGAVILRELAASEEACLVALQHHERMDGRGYPFGLNGGELHPFTKLCAVANQFDSLTASRPAVPGAPARQVLLGLWAGRDVVLEPEAVSALASLIGVYPVGTQVRVESGEYGIVTAPNPRDASRPVVKLQWDRAGRPLRMPLSLDLSGSGPRIVEVDGEWIDPDAEPLPTGPPSQ